MRRIFAIVGTCVALVSAVGLGAASRVGAGGQPQLTASVTAAPLSITVGETFTATGTWQITTPFASGTTINVLLEMQGTNGLVAFDDPPVASPGLTGCAFVATPEPRRVYRCTIANAASVQTYTITAVGRPTDVPPTGGVILTASTSGAVSVLSANVDVAIAAAPTTTTTTTTTVPATTTTAPTTTTTVAPTSTTTVAPTSTTAAGSGTIPNTGSSNGSMLVIAALLVACGAVTMLLGRRRSMRS